MDVRTYCNNMGIELTAWKAKIYDAIRKVDKLSTGDKEKVYPVVQDIHMIVEELGDRLIELDKECPSEWSPQKKEIDTKFEKLKQDLADVWGKIEGPLVYDTQV
ncbi:MAG: hypothetical protein SWH61_02420 [Thermodesulfobacteriota bacterium]|nr:hypothetical protein [Thermodesulfobacteriota bacterium]